MSIDVIKAEQRQRQETAGIPVPVLRAIGKELARAARKRPADLLPLARLLWDEYGREGRVVALIPLGAIELSDPEGTIPLLAEMCRTCVTWEDADRLAMDALEPIVRKDPKSWLGALDPWLADPNKWLRRAGVTVVGRLPMKQPAYTGHCVAMAEGLLHDSEVDVRRAVSFALRLSARGDPEPVRALLERNVPPVDPATTWVLCDVVRSMTKTLLPHFLQVLPSYEEWARDPELNAQERKSVESAVKILHQAREQ
jgi:3-methyladenine DNA glycosylase AlkD